MNHSKSNSPVNFCPNCGESLKRVVLLPRCQDAAHASKRKDQNKFCIDCGKKL